MRRTLTFSSGAGATTAWESAGDRWRSVGMVSGAGATTDDGKCWHSKIRRCRCRRSERDRRLRWSLRPGHDVGQRYIVIQLDVGRSDDGLAAIVGLGRYRNNRLRRVMPGRPFAAEVSGCRRYRAAEDIRKARSRSRRARLKACCTTTSGFWGQNCTEANDRCDRRNMTEHRQGKPAPRQAGGNENVRPERAGRGRWLKRSLLTGTKQVGQVAEEDRMPGGQIHEEYGRRHGSW